MSTPLIVGQAEQLSPDRLCSGVVTCLLIGQAPIVVGPGEARVKPDRFREISDGLVEVV